MLKLGENENKQLCSIEEDAVEAEVLQAIEKAECFIKDIMRASEPVNSILQVPTQENPISSHILVNQHSVGEETSVAAIGSCNSRLKPSKVPI